MKRFAVAASVVLALGTVALSACGNAEKEKELTGQIESLKKENETLSAKVKELETNLATVTKERDDMKAAAEATPEPTPEPAKGGAKKPKAAAPAATPAAATAAPAATPEERRKIDRPGLKQPAKVK